MSCKSLLPQNIDPAINALDLAGCEGLQEIEKALAKIERFHDALGIDEEFLDLLADSYEAKRFKDFEPKARELILYAQRHYPKLGTVAAVKEVLYAFGLDAVVKEWFETGKPPYIFDLDLSVSDRPISKELVEQIYKLVEFTKNIRSKLGELLLSYKVEHSLDAASGAVGEAGGEGQMAAGYVESSASRVFGASGAVGEALASTKAIGVESKNALLALFRAGLVAEAEARTICKEVG